MKLIFNLLCEHIFIHFRRRRMSRFFMLFAPSPETRVLDIGGAPQTWNSDSASEVRFPVMLINIRDYGLMENVLLLFPSKLGVPLIRQSGKTISCTVRRG